MKAARAVYLSLACAVAACAAQPPTLEEAIRERFAASDADVVGFYFRDLAGRDSLLIDADVRLHAASTMKVPVMIQVFRDMERGHLSLADSIAITNTFRSIVDGSQYAMGRADDSDSTLYDRDGERVSVRELVELMITVSSNLAANMLIELVDAERVTATMRELGADSIEVLRGVEDIKAYRAGLSNTTTARDLGVILGAIADGSAASESSCREMEAILGRQQFNEGIPAGVPPDVRVAHKTGNITAIHHDAAIVTHGDRRYVLVVLVSGIDDESESARLIADVSRIVHSHHMD